MVAETKEQGVDAASAAPIGTDNAQPVLDVRDPSFMARAYEIYDELRDEGRVVTVRFTRDDDPANDGSPRSAFFRRPSKFVTHYDDVVETLFNDDFSVDMAANMAAQAKAEGKPVEEIPEEFRPIARSIISLDPPDHTRIRKLVQPAFTGRTMDAMRGKIQETVDTLLDRAERAAAERGETPGNRRMELISDFAYPFPVTVISDLLGIPREDRAQIKGWTENLLRADRGTNKEMEEEVRAGLREFIAYLKVLFERKSRQPEDDMISHMVAVTEDGDVLTEEEMLATVFLMYLAGHVTTVNLVGNGIVALLSNPSELAKMQADPTLAKNMVEETLRYWGPVDFVGRRMATEDMVVAGAPVKKGEQITAGLASANHDPDRFANPEVYDITRSNANRHVAFGRGIHVCLGAPLARVEGQVAFETLVRRYPNLRLAVPEDEIQWSGNFLRGFRQVPLLY
jgi:cytochrome P450 PksS